MNDYPIRARKPINDTHLTRCDVDDPEATHFEINYLALGCDWTTSINVTDKFHAEQIQSAMLAAHRDGRKAAFAELRHLIGANR